MDSEKGWSADFVSTADRNFDCVDILYNGKDIATIKKAGKDILISWIKPEKDYDIPLDWFIGLLQKAKETLA
jgi:hypothetical protein